MKNKVSIRWIGNMAFEGEDGGHKIMLDATHESGGGDQGPSPKPLMLLALAGCTGMDVVAILKKMRVELDDFQVFVEGDLTEELPKQYEKMKVIFQFKGKDLPKDKLEKAVSLSEEKYCGVSDLYKKVIPLDYEIRVVE